ncbi:MAG: hypothetical protein OHK0039_11810 [Bacteroidia bacterium]
MLGCLVAGYLLLVCSGCNLAETNINPNNPTDVPLSVLLPPALESAAGELAEDAAVYAGIFCQYFTGVDNQALPVESYLLDESFNMNPLWQDFYTTSLHSLHLVIDKAQTQQAPHYGGVGKVMMALMLGTVTSLWGDVPYSQAFQGADNLNPAYDDQEAIYQTIQQLLDEAIADLDATTSVFSPGADDVIFQGNRTRWKKTAYALKARYHLHLVKRDPAAASLALAALGAAYTASSEEMTYTFGFTAAEQNPWFVYFRNTPYIEVDPYFVDLLKGQADPREKALIRRTFGINRVGDYYAGEFAAVPIITYAEVKFMEAECRVRLGQGDAAASLQAAIAAHTQQVVGSSLPTDSIARFAARVGSLSGDPATDLGRIITQKYISHFTQIEGWTDYRRTGWPALSPNTGGDNPQNPGGAIPRRFIYPQRERLFNAQFPPNNPNLQDRFWWDQ